MPEYFDLALFVKQGWIRAEFSNSISCSLVWLQLGRDEDLIKELELNEDDEQTLTCKADHINNPC